MARWLIVLALAFAPAVAFADPPETHEILTDRPSGFWTSNRPAVGGAYRYRLLGIGCAVCLATGLLTWRLVRKANRERPTTASRTAAKS